MSDTSQHSYSSLTPDLLLDAVESVGYHCDGRLLALNSYENRVYQVGLEEGHTKHIIAKFYRPERWLDAQILEEHDFALALADAEIPVVPPIMLNNNTLHKHAGFRFALFEKRGGRAPELDRADVREWIGRFWVAFIWWEVLRLFKHDLRLISKHLVKHRAVAEFEPIYPRRHPCCLAFGGGFGACGGA